AATAVFVSSGVSVTSSSTGSGARAATMRSAAARPRSLSADGWIPCASSRSSFTAAATSAAAESTAASGDEATPGVVRSRNDPRPRSPHLGLVPLPVRDVGPGDQPRTARLDLRQRRARPGDVDLTTVALQPAAFALRGGAGPNGAEDAVTRDGASAVRHVALPEELAPGLVGLVAERPLERLVGREGTYASVGVDEADEAGSVVRDSAEELALTLELGDPRLQERRRRLRRAPLFGPGHLSGRRSSFGEPGQAVVGQRLPRRGVRDVLTVLRPDAGVVVECTEPHAECAGRRIAAPQRAAARPTERLDPSVGG